MAYASLRLIPALMFAASLNLPSIAQSPTPHSQNQPLGGLVATPGLTVRTYSRMVSLDVVVEDKAGYHLTGLKAGDFKIEEQTPSRSGNKREQKIAVFREIHTAALKPPVGPPVIKEPGVYTNAVTTQEDPVPPTVLVVDGVNTDIQIQAQVHQQMLKILRQLPPNVPVAVILMGDKLTLLQGFTTDPKLLQQALAKAENLPTGPLHDPDYDPDAPSNLMFGLGGGAGDYSGAVVAAIRGFDKDIYEWGIQQRTIKTCDMFVSIAQSLAGYPGRKNLLWLSTSFPVKMYVPWAPKNAAHAALYDNHEIPMHMQILNNALSDAKVAVYPVDLVGVTTLSAFTAQTRLGAPSPAPGQDAIAKANSSQVDELYKEHITMYDLAEGTGGKVCTGDNDLGDCVHKAVDDSSDFYEISYYPDSPDWNGEYRKVFLETQQHGAHLSYRQGYYATPEGSPDPQNQAAELQDHCNDMLNATAIAFTAKSLPADSPDQLKFSLTVDPTAVSLPAIGDGNYQLNLEVAVCTYNEKQSPLNLMNYPVSIKLNARQYANVNATGKLTDTVRVPGPKPAAVRLLVKDVVTGRLGSIYIKTSDLVAAIPH